MPNTILATAANAGSWSAAGNSATVGANGGLLPISIPTITPGGEPTFDESVGMDSEIQYADRFSDVVEFELPFKMRRTGAEWRFWANLFGDDTVTGSNPYTHTFNWQTESTLKCSIAGEIDDTDIFEFPFVKIIGAKIASAGDGHVEVTYKCIANTVKLASDATNSGTEFDAVTYVTKTLIVPWKETRIRLNGQADGALDASDEQACIGFTLDIERAMTADEATRGTSNGAEIQVLEPARDGYTNITLSLQYSSLDDFSLTDDVQDQTAYKADLYWAKTITTAFSFLIELPHLIPVQNAATIEGGKRIPYERIFRAVQAQSTPTGMATGNIIHGVLVDAQSGTYE